MSGSKISPSDLVMEFQTGILSQESLVSYCQKNERAFVENYYAFACEARYASVYALLQAFNESKRDVDKDMYLVLIAQEYLQLLEVLDMVVTGFVRRNKKDSMFYVMLTTTCSPANLKTLTSSPKKAIKKFRLDSITDSELRGKVEKAWLELAPTINQAAAFLEDYWPFYNKMKHGFIVWGRQYNHDKECAAILGHRSMNDGLHELRHLDLPLNRISIITNNVDAIKRLVEEFLAARLYELREKR